MSQSVWFKNWPEKKISALLMQSTLDRYEKGALVYRDFISHDLAFVVSGALWVTLAEIPGGKSGILYAPSLIGIAQLLGENQNEPVLFEFHAARTTQILRIPATAFLKVLDGAPNLWRELAESTIRYHRNCVRLTLSMSLGSLRDKVIWILYQFGLQLTEQNVIGTSLGLQLSQEDLASIIQASRQRVNSVLRELEQEDLLRLGYKTIDIIDAPRLASLALAFKPS